MATTSATGYRWTALMQRIEESAKSLAEPYARVDELVNRLENLCRLLQRVEQQPSPAMEVAIKFPTEALIAEELFKNDFLNVKISVGCCITEIARITAPEPPYEYNRMREVSDLLMTVLKNLSSVTGTAYTKIAYVLDNMAKCHLFMAMWDCDDAFIIEMFQDFLHLQTNHSDNVISSMEKIMTLTMKEDDIPTELFTILLNTLRRENENVSPVSYYLAERVFHNCADELNRRLPREVRLSDIALPNYSGIVARVLNGSEKLQAEVDDTGEIDQSACQPSLLINDAGPSRTEATVQMKTLQSCDLTQQDSAENYCPCDNRDAKAKHDLESKFITTQKNEESLKGVTPLEISSVCAPILQKNISDAPHWTQYQDSAGADILQEEIFAAAVSAVSPPKSKEDSSMDNNSSKLLHACNQMEQHNVSDKSCSQRKKYNAAKIVLKDASKISQEIGKDKASLVLFQCCDQNRLLKDSEAKGDAGSVSPDVAVHQSPDQGTVSTSRKRGRKPNSLVKPEEGYDNSWIQSEMKAPGVSCRRQSHRKVIGDPSKKSVSKTKFLKSGLAVETALEVQIQSLPNGKSSRKGKIRDAGKMSTEIGGLELSSVPARDVVMTSLEMEHCKSPRHTVQATVRYGCSRNPEKRDGSPVQMVPNRQSTGRTTSEHIGETSKLKILAYHKTPESSTPEVDEVSNPESKRSHTQPTEEVSEHTLSSKVNEETLVGRKIKVLWPLDEMCYIGHVTSFDAETKRHKVIYDDGDEEVLDLIREQWELLGDDFVSDSLQGPGSFDNAVTLHMSNNAASSSQPSTKKHEVTDEVSNEHGSTSNGKRLLKYLSSRSKLEQDRATDLENPTTMNLPCPEQQGKTHSRSSQDLEGDEVQTETIKPSPLFSVRVGSKGCGIFNYHRYQVKSSSTPIFDAIYSKYGDIAANCLFKSPNLRAWLLEVVGNVVHRLKNCVITASDIKSMISEISDVADAKINVSWLQQYLADIAHEEEAVKRASELRRKGCLILGAAKKDYEQSKAELIAVQENFKNAETRVKALKHVLERIESGILESVAKNKSWQERLDKLLTSD